MPSEQPPSPESEFSAEELRLIALLKERGIEDPETREAYETWFAGEQRIADEKAERGEVTTANVEFQLRVGALQEAAGFLDAAYDTFYEAAYMAEQNSAPEELRFKAVSAFEKLRGK
jgi:hypothetical protein